MTSTSASTLSQQPGNLRLALLIIALGTLLGPLDTSVNVAFPIITRSFHLAISDIQWIVASYIIVQSGLTLGFGQLGDLYGHRLIFRWGLAACAITHLLCSLAPTYPLLIAGRVAQGIAVGLAMACGPALATLLFPEHLRRQILALYVMLLGAGIALGPLIGGLLLDWGGWPAVFWFRTPVALLALLLSIWLPEPKISLPSKPRFDYFGVLFLTLSLASLILLIHMARRPDASAFSISVFLALCAACLWAFVRHETHFSQPILHIRYLRDRVFRQLQLSSLVLNLCGFSIFLLLPYALDRHLKASALMIGVTLAISPIGAVVAGLVGARKSELWSANRLIFTGMASTSLALMALGFSLSTDSKLLITAALFATGLGIGLFQIGYMDKTTTTLPPSQRGVAGSLLNVTRVAGGVIGAATITWMLDAWHLVYPGLTAYQLSFGSLGVLLGCFSTLSYLILRASR